MPVHKSLYMGKSLGDLNSFVDEIPPSDPNRLCKSAVKLFNAAEKHRLEGDEEKSYVLYMRYFNAIKHIHTSAEFKKDKKYFESMIGKNTYKDAFGWAEKLAASLEKRYKLLKEEDEVRKILAAKPELLLIVNDDVKGESDQKKSEINKTEVSSTVADTPGSITCQTLYRLLMDKNNTVIIMDARPADEYNLSHINHSSCINIPAESIKPGITAPKLDSVIPAASKILWSKRADVDIIVLLDWFSSVSVPPIGPELAALKDAIFKWDMKTALKSEPLILKSGFDSWLTYYPSMTTDPLIVRPKLKSLSNLESVTLNFEYPDDLDKAFIESPSDSPNETENSSLTNNSLNQNEQSATDISNNLKPLPSVNRASKPALPIVSTSPSAYSKVLNKGKSINIPSKDAISIPQAAVTTDEVAIPKVNRSLKPVVDIRVAKEEQRAAEEILSEKQLIREMVSKDKENMDSSLNLERELLKKEQEIYNIRLRREKEAEESMKLELQKQELVLLDKLSMMEKRQNEMNSESNKTKEENERLRQKLEELIKQNDEDCRKLKDELIKSQTKEKERKKLEKEVQRLRVERKKKAITNIIPKKQDDEISTPKEFHVESPASSSTPVVKGVLTNFTKLKGDGTSQEKQQAFKGNLSRSQSFPNIAQQVDDEDSQSVGSKNLSRSSADSSRQDRIKPLVNRDVKPSVVEINAATSRNFMPVYGGQGRALCGLRNLGNTCYANSVIQCLANTTPLVKYFVEGNYRRDINRNSKSGHQGELVEEFAAVIRALWTGQYRSLSPRDFLRVIGEYKKEFVGYEQQDSQEFLNILIDRLHEDLNQANQAQFKEHQKERSSLEDSNLEDGTLAVKSWEIHKLLNNSIFVQLFQGQYKSTLRCLHCSKTSTKFDTFMFLSLPIPSGNRCTLKDCLNLYLKEEKLTGSSKWNCPRCKEPREAVKKIDIWKLPPVLLIFFKRFFYEGMWKKKLQTYIDFSVTDLDLTAYVKGPEKKTTFNLFGVTNHSGTLDGGHYIAFCKNSFRDRWFKFDDQNVTEMHSSDIKSASAYILYYTSFIQ